MAKTARDIMSDDCTCIGENDSVLDAAKRLAELDVGSMPICGEDNRLKGMLTDRDIVVKVLAQGKDPAQTKAGELGVGDGKTVTIGADDSVDDALRTMIEHKVRRLPGHRRARPRGHRQPGGHRHEPRRGEGRRPGRGDLRGAVGGTLAQAASLAREAAGAVESGSVPRIEGRGSGPLLACIDRLIQCGSLLPSSSPSSSPWRSRSCCGRAYRRRRGFLVSCRAGERGLELRRQNRPMVGATSWRADPARLGRRGRRAPPVARRAPCEERPRPGPRLRHRRRQRAAGVRLDLRRLPPRGAVRRGPRSAGRRRASSGGRAARARARAGRTISRAGPSSRSAPWPYAQRSASSPSDWCPTPMGSRRPPGPRSCSPLSPCWGSAPDWRRSSGGSCAGPSRSPARRWSPPTTRSAPSPSRAPPGRGWTAAPGLQAPRRARAPGRRRRSAARGHGRPGGGVSHPLAVACPWRRPVAAAAARGGRRGRTVGVILEIDTRSTVALLRAACASRSRRSCSRTAWRAR